jgi:hypothetical protein
MVERVAEEWPLVALKTIMEKLRGVGGHAVVGVCYGEFAGLLELS